MKHVVLGAEEIPIAVLEEGEDLTAWQQDANTVAIVNLESVPDDILVAPYRYVNGEIVPVEPEPAPPEESE